MEQIIFTKYSAERSRDFAIRTDIIKNENGLYVEKRPLYPQGKAHVERLLQWQTLLSEEYEKEQFLVNHCQGTENGVRLEYLTGKNLQQWLEQLNERGYQQEIRSYIEGYLSRMTEKGKWINYHKTDDFVQVFGDVQLPENLKCRRVTNIDMILSNIILDDNGRDWHFIDYEWTFDFPIPVNFVLYRAFFMAYHETSNIRCLDFTQMMQRLGIGVQEQQAYAQMESNFQNYIRGKEKPVRDIMRDMGYRTIAMSQIEECFGMYQFPKTWLTFHGIEEGAEAMNREAVPAKTAGESVWLKEQIPKGAEELEFIIESGSCLLYARNLKADGLEMPVVGWKANGMELGKGLYLILSEQARVIIPCKGKQELEMCLQLQSLDTQVNQQLVGCLNELYGKRTALEEENILLKHKVAKIERLALYRIYKKIRGCWKSERKIT